MSNIARQKSGATYYSGYDKRFAPAPQTNYPNGKILFQLDPMTGEGKYTSLPVDDCDIVTLQGYAAEEGGSPAYTVEGKLFENSEDWVALTPLKYGTVEAVDPAIADNGIYEFNVRSLAAIRVADVDGAKAVVAKVESYSSL